MKRVAAIDIGTNTILLLIAERPHTTTTSPEGTLSPVLERATIVRLGQDVDKRRELRRDRVEDALRCLEQYAALVNDHDVAATVVVGTSAMRDARGGEKLLSAIESLFHTSLRVISGAEEARLTFLGGLSGLNLSSEREVALFDVGGGSTEIVLGARSDEGWSIQSSTSVDIGSVRLFERHLRGDPPSPQELHALREDVRAALATQAGLQVSGATRGRTVVGVAGTVTALAAISLEMRTYDPARIHGFKMTRQKIEALFDVLAGMPIHERNELPGLEPKRADVILAGAACVLGALEFLGAEELIVSDRGLRWGLAAEASLS